jgi:hypothetical protein
MKIPLLLQQIWPLFKFEVIRAFNFVKSNDVAKLFLLICITMNSSKLTSDVVNDYLILTELSVKAVSLGLSFFVFVGMMITLYYLSFNLKKTIYQIPKKYYIFFISVNSIKLLMTFCTPNNFIAIISFEVFYIFVMSAFVFDLRKIALQQRENLHISIFNVVNKNTGLVIIASTPDSFFSKRNKMFTNYMIGFNKNIKTWLILGVFIKMDKEGIYLKNIYMTYSEVVMFNNNFDKKIIDYTKNELDTVIMYFI